MVIMVTMIMMEEQEEEEGDRDEDEDEDWDENYSLLTKIVKQDRDQHPTPTALTSKVWPGSRSRGGGRTCTAGLTVWVNFWSF